ncbi:2-oxo acid dehydrogenase subunit E2 [Aliigemmobacter aestuarii]|uniref:Dihydrolipoamide acetyltransferase component of pyruvate dehydrogenase complex n=1 Tax=Aliigemmobacter aestuarii TaxID=1445661 RepID=A0A4S3MN87_9RHOB|nr:dihydrolipoamide acetyltransferase family protein [Gemmobacter aestuarii]THD82347.1 2-oxo acid dehydrogenase subunit E2 [Gemmobacter aestuarii]
MSVFAMPSLGADMEAGTLVQWLVNPGDRVTRGDVVAVVETQKGAIEIEIFETGEIAELLADLGQTLPVGAPLARLATGEDEAPLAVAKPAAGPTAAPAAASAAPPSATEPPAPVEVAVLPLSAVPPAPVGGVVAASPAARTRAAEAGLALAAVSGTGPQGAVLLGDVERHLAAGPAPVADTVAAPPKGKPRLDMAEMRRAIAAAMTRAKREIPHYYLTHEIDLQAAQDWLAATNASRTPDRRLLMGALLVRATVRALAKAPELNGRFEAEPYAPSGPVHCGLAVALRGGGLIAPAILDAAEKGVEAIMEAMRDLVTRTRAGRLRNSELTQGTITISSLGETGVDALTGVIYPPQVALVGFGAPRVRPMVRDGRIEPRLAITVSLAADHRVSDGRRGAAFLAAIDQILQEPETL